MAQEPVAVELVLALDSSASVRADMLSIQKAAHRFIKKLASGDVRSLAKVP